VEIALPDLMPLVHARDAAFGKVAAIGTVNPRSGGVLNSLVQAWKRLVARVLDWHVREQVEFNRKSMACIDAALEAMADFNRALVALGNRIAEQDKSARRTGGAEGHPQSLGRMARRVGAQAGAERNAVPALRGGFAGGFQHRATLMDANYRDAMRGQHTEFTGALERFSLDIQQRLWADLERIRLEYERLIYSELKTIRQRAAVSGVSEARQTTKDDGLSHMPLGFDYGRFAERFRGTEEYVKAGQQIYLPHFRACRNVLDIGCGRGEFLEMMQAAGIPAKGIDLDPESVATCRHKTLDAEVADLFVYLENLPEASLDGIFCSQVVEHLPPERLPEMIRLCASRLQRNGVSPSRRPTRSAWRSSPRTSTWTPPISGRCRTPCWRFTWRNSGWEISKCASSRPRRNRCPR
jgi:2-polyprenyl-3-methyl-5-hydroxy-6-metoxy-1,4-benzoquinol methylase